MTDIIFHPSQKYHFNFKNSLLFIFTLSFPFFFSLFIFFIGSMTGVPGVPENVTVMFLSPTSVRVSWSTSQVDQVEKYDVTYKPTDARCVVKWLI